MPLIAIREMVRKDLQVFFSDRRAVIMAFAMPIAIASFFGFIFGGQSNNGQPSRLDVLLVDEDASTISKGIVAGVSADRNLAATLVSADTARDRVRRGASSVAVVIPAGFGDAAGRAFFSNAGKPQLRILYDPSHSMERAMVSGLMTQHVMEAVSREMFGGAHGQQLMDEMAANLASSPMSPQRQLLLRQLMLSAKRFTAADSGAGERAGLSMPYDVHEEAVTARTNATYNGYAHSFAGMGIQFLLFAAINLGVEVLAERQRGLWKRLRSAPISRATLLGGKLSSTTVIGTLVLLVSCGVAILVWHGRLSRRRGRVRADGVGVRSARRVARQDAERGARRVDFRDAHHGDARRRVGADVRLSHVAAAAHDRGADALGRGRLRRHDLARAGNRKRGDADRRPARNSRCSSRRSRCGGFGGRRRRIPLY
jgi:ABC-2 type transport system permease protein